MKDRIKNTIRNHYFVTFTIIFCIVGIIAFHPFWWNDRSFIWVGETKDGLLQHYNALMYLGKWGRSIILDIFQNHTLEIPLWDFSIGYGSDIISTLHYYAFGDPLNLLSIIVPSKYTEYLYDFLVILRLYLLGVSFSLYCFHMNQKKTASFIGAFTYMFSGYALYAFARHPFFINPMIYLPMLFIGAEKIMEKKKPTLLMGVVFLMTISNFYFSYMLLFMLVIYVGIRFFSKKHMCLIKEGVEYCIKFGLSILVGLMMSSIIFFPVVNLLFTGERMHSETNVPWLYNWVYYERLLSQFVTSGENGKWVCLGFVPIALIAVVYIFLKKNKYRELKIGMIILSIMLIFPVFGSLLNGMSYATNRWTFAYAFLVAYILTASWDELIHMSKQEQKKIVAIVSIYFALLLVIGKGTNENSMATMMSVGVTLLVLVLADQTKQNYKQLVAFVMFGITVVSIGINVKYRFDMDEGNYIEEFIDRGTARKTLYQTGDYAIRKIVGEQSTIERVDQPDELVNSACQNGTYGINYFWSMENGEIGRFMKEMGNEIFYTQSFKNLDSRTMLNALVAVKYYTDENESNNIPFGYKELDQVDINRKEGVRKYKVYENQYALPLGITYDKIILNEKYQKMSSVERQQALLQGVLLNEKIKGYEEVEEKYSHENIDYRVECSDNVVRKDGKYIATNDNAKITLYFDGRDNCETYVYFPELSVKEQTMKDFYEGSKNIYSKSDWDQLSKMTKNKYNYEEKYFKSDGKNFIDFTSEYNTTSIRCLSSDNPWNTGQTEYIANMGYHEKGIKSVTITLKKKGEYDLKGMKVICQPMEDYVENVNHLSQNVMENEKIGINKISGNVDLDKNKILYLSIPYCEGWSACVDGKKVDILKGNSIGMAIPLKEGKHEIELKYVTPGLKEGLIFSAIGLSVFMICVCWPSKNKGKKKKRIL